MTKGQILENSDFCQSINNIFSTYKILKDSNERNGFMILRNNYL